MEQGAIEGIPWYSAQWFSPSIFQNYSWENESALYLLLIIPLILLIRWLVRRNLSQKLPVSVPSDKIRWNPVTLLRFIPNILMTLILALIIISIARPQKTNEKVEQWTEGIDIMLVVDISESMQIADFKPNRLEAAKDVADDFIDGRFQDRIGMVIFSGDAYSLSPLTTDYDLLKQYIEQISFEMIENRGN